MPKDRKKTYSDHQSQAARQKKQEPKKAQSADDFSQAAPKIEREATKQK